MRKQIIAIIAALTVSHCGPGPEDMGELRAPCSEGFINRLGRCCPIGSTVTQCPNPVLASSLCDGTSGIQPGQACPALPTTVYVGMPCTTSQDCLGLGGGVVCLTYVPGGYCDRGCNTDADCGPTAACKLPNHICLLRCSLRPNEFVSFCRGHNASTRPRAGTDEESILLYCSDRGASVPVCAPFPQ